MHKGTIICILNIIICSFFVLKARSKVESEESLVYAHGKKNGPSVLSSSDGAYCKNKSIVEVRE